MGSTNIRRFLTGGAVHCKRGGNAIQLTMTGLPTDLRGNRVSIPQRHGKLIASHRFFARFSRLAGERVVDSELKTSNSPTSETFRKLTCGKSMRCVPVQEFTTLPMRRINTSLTQHWERCRLGVITVVKGWERSPKYASRCFRNKKKSQRKGLNG